MATIRRFTAALISGAMLLSAAPAFALSVYTESSGGTSTSTVNARATTNVRTNLGLSATIWNKCHHLQNDPNKTDDEYDKCAAAAKADFEANGGASVNVKEFKSEVKTYINDVRTDAKTNIDAAKTATVETHNWLQRWKHHFLNRFSRMITQAGSLAKRICNAQNNNDQSLAKACLANMKAEFKAKVDAAIEASFSN